MYRCAVTVFTALLLSGCGGPEPASTTLASLGNAQLDFSGRHVRVSGTLRSWDKPLHYWIENEALDRVALEIDDNLLPPVGTQVTVEGRFIYDRSAGRRIEVTSLVPAGP